MRSSVRTLTWAFGIAAVVGFALASNAVQAAKFKVLHSFCERNRCKDGSIPEAALVMDSAGNFFGTTAKGGMGNGFGTIFELVRKPSGAFAFKTIYRFCGNECGSGPTGPLILDAQGNLYGEADDAVFKLSPTGKSWMLTYLYRFCTQHGCPDGNAPTGGLTYAGASSGTPYDGDSPLYGVTQLGGANNGGTVFQLTNNGGSWSESVLYDFCSQGGDKCTDGKAPQGALVMDALGNLYGVTVQGGQNAPGMDGAGVAFELAKANGNGWSETTLYSFCATAHCTDGARPLAGLAIDAAGSLYGTTSRGGNRCSAQSQGCGVVFKIVPNGAASQESVLYALCKKTDCKDGSVSLGSLFLDDAGNIFGTTFQGGGNDIDEFGLGGGTVFELSGASFKVLYRFCSLTACADGEYPSAGVTLNSSGQLFGVTELGGAFGQSVDGGVVFQIIP